MEGGREMIDDRRVSWADREVMLSISSSNGEEMVFEKNNEMHRVRWEVLCSLYNKHETI